MVDQYSSDTNNEGTIARDRRRARELGEEGLALAKCEAQRLIQCLGREPTVAERILIEHVATVDVRARTLRAWGRHKEADAVTLILSKLLNDFHKMRPRS